MEGKVDADLPRRDPLSLAGLYPSVGPTLSTRQGKIRTGRAGPAGVDPREAKFFEVDFNGQFMVHLVHLISL